MWKAALLPETDALLRKWQAEGQIELLVLDALRWSDPHPVHATATESIALASRLRPRRTLLVGMGHSMEHEESNRQLKAAAPDLDITLAYDGQCVPLRM